MRAIMTKKKEIESAERHLSECRRHTMNQLLQRTELKENPAEIWTLSTTDRYPASKPHGPEVVARPRHEIRESVINIITYEVF